MVLLEWPRSFPSFPLSVQITMNGAELEANSPTVDPALSGNSGDLEKEVQASEVADNLETMQITEEEPPNQPKAREEVADATTPTPEPAQLRPACKQAASGAFRIDRRGDELAETITGILHGRDASSQRVDFR